MWNNETEVEMDEVDNHDDDDDDDYTILSIVEMIVRTKGVCVCVCRTTALPSLLLLTDCNLIE